MATLKIANAVKWGKLSAGVKEYEDRSFDWWENRLQQLAGERKWCALLVVLTMLNDSGVLTRLNTIKEQRGKGNKSVACLLFSKDKPGLAKSK